MLSQESSCQCVGRRILTLKQTLDKEQIMNYDSSRSGCDTPAASAPRRAGLLFRHPGAVFPTQHHQKRPMPQPSSARETHILPTPIDRATFTQPLQNGGPMPILTDEIKEFIVKGLACYDTPTYVAEAV